MPEDWESIMYLDYLNKYRKVWQHTRSLPEPLAGFLILLLLAACSPSIRTWRDFLAGPTQQSLDDSLSIYTALLKDVYPQEKEFIIDRSTQPFRGELDTIMENSLLPGLPQET